MVAQLEGEERQTANDLPKHVNVGRGIPSVHRQHLWLQGIGWV